MRAFLFLGLLLGVVVIGYAADEKDERHWRATTFPILEKHCNSCHNAADQKAGINFDDFYFIASVISRGELWQNIIEQIETGAMPPEGKPKMTDAEKDSMIAVVNKVLDGALANPDPGRSVMRRLSHREYSYTVKDLIGVDFDAQRFFPKEGSGGEGFDNSSGVLFVTALMMERYYMAADSIVRMTKHNDALWQELVPTSYRPSIFRRATNWFRSLVSSEEIRWSAPSRRAEEVILPFAARSYRRFLSQEEQTDLLSFFEKIYFDQLWKESDGFTTALATTFKRILVSPNFLYRTEINAPIHKPYPVSNLELATRLSYFFWSSMPDDTLMQTAYREDLHDSKILNREARRMMANPKFKRFSNSFAPQWLGVEEALVNPMADKELFPEFTEELRVSMKNEVVDYFHYVFTEKHNLLELVDSDYSLIDESLAKHYGVPDVSGPELRLVDVSEYGRGGILGMGAVLAATSLPNRTSPVLRGQWVLEQILGTPAPPPPPDIPSLEEEVNAGGHNLGVRKLLEKHRADPACSSCHVKMDPIGFAMENFDAIGRWRTYYQGEASIDASAIMENGTMIEGPIELRKEISEEKEKLAENFCRKIMSYALGRGIGFTDSPVIKEMTKTLMENNFDSEEMMLAAVNSYPFRHRRSDVSELYIY